MSAANYPRIHPKTTAEWRRWLRDNHDKAQGVWLVMYKAATGKTRLAYEDSIPDALCFGWIDSLNKPLDDERTALLFTPRKTGSGWSRTNKERIARLLKNGRMEAAGLAKITAAKRDGSWTLLDSVEALEVPDDLRRALGGHAQVRHAHARPEEGTSAHSGDGEEAIDAREADRRYRASGPGGRRGRTLTETK